MKEPSWPRLAMVLRANGLTPDADGRYSIRDLAILHAGDTDMYPEHICRAAAINSLRADGLLRP